MKRLISLCCVVLIFVFSLAAPVMASSVAGSNFYELLDYGGIDGGNIYFFTSPAGGRSVSLNLPAYGAVYYYDVLFRYSGGTVSGVTANIGSTSTALTIIAVGSGLYRAYGSSTGGSGDSINLTFTNSAASYIELKSVKVSSLKVDHFTTDSYCQIISLEYNETIHFVPTDSINHRYVDASYFDEVDSQFTMALTVTDWQKFDYIDFEMYLSVDSISSISASQGDIILKTVSCETNNDNSTLSDYRIYATLDLTGADRTSNIIPSIIITGHWSVGWINFVSMVGTSGFVQISERNPYTTHLINIANGIVSGFANLQIWISNQTTSFVNSISEQTTLISNAILEQTSSINNYIEATRSNLLTVLNRIDSTISTKISLVISTIQSSITEQTTKLESAIRGDTSSGDAFQGEVQEELDELDQAQAVMDSVTKPAIEDINVSVDKYVSQADINVLASPMAAFFENQLFSRMIIMSILLATVSYVLYGKR